MAKSTVAWDVSFGYENNTAINLWNYVPPDPNMGPASPNVDFWKIGKNIVGGTEDPALGYEFDVPTLSNFKLFPFVDEVDGNLPAITPMEVGIHGHKDSDGTIWAGFNALGFVDNDMHLYQV
uniref:Uncharacterized protein n=1 Tax=Acrobeloides nanus TaxID=290746 RepID=A0A914EJG9_9BILA